MPERSSKPLTGRTVLFALLGFFGVVIGVNMVMVKLAIDTLPGTEVDSAYKASLAFNTEVSAAREQAVRGWQVTGHVERDPAGRASIRVEARDRNGAPLAGLAFSVRLERPTDKRADRALVLAEREAGLYRGQTDDVAPGQWDVVIEGERGTERVFLSKNRIVLQ